MRIGVAKPSEIAEVLRYDRHIQRERLQKALEDGLVYALYEDQTIVGVLRYSLFWQSIPFVDLLYIDGSRQRQGHGRAMMTDWEDRMRERGFDHVMLSTQADEEAKYFYEKLGYRNIGAFLPPEQEADELMYLKELR